MERNNKLLRFDRAYDLVHDPLIQEDFTVTHVFVSGPGSRCGGLST